MSNMSNLDVVLSELKLSEPQKNAVIEVIETSFPTNAKKVTLTSLVKRGLLELVEGTTDNYTLSEDLANKLGVGELQKLAESQGIVLSHEDAVEAIQNELNTNMQDVEVTTDEVEAVSQMIETEFDKFDSKWNALFKETAGFGETLNWKGVEVWDGLTAAEIREDIETATPINRKARRTHYITLRNAFRRLDNRKAKTADPTHSRKALKLTGGKAL
jgi:hypothetical protein